MNSCDNARIYVEAMGLVPEIVNDMSNSEG